MFLLSKEGIVLMSVKVIALIALGILFAFQTWLEILSSSAAKREIPENVRDIYDEEEYTKWLAYDREKNRLSFVRHIASFLVMFLVIGFDVYANILKLFGASEDLYRNSMIVLLADMVIGLLYAIPISYVDTMKVEQKYGFNRTTKKTFVVDQVKELIIGVIINCGICALFIAIHQALGNWMLVVFTGVMLLIVLIMVFLSPLMAKIYNKLDPLPEGELRSRLTELLESNGCTVRDIKVADASKRSSKANAYFSGLGKSKTIVLYDTLLEQMTDDEIVAVFAHEMGHNKHKDTLVMYGMNMVNIVVFVVLAWALVSREGIYAWFGFEGINYGFAFILLFGVCMPFVSPFIGLLSNHLIRSREYGADRFAAENGYGEALITGLKKLTKNSFACLSPHPLIVKLTYSHPTLSQRITALEEFEKNKKS